MLTGYFVELLIADPLAGRNHEHPGAILDDNKESPEDQTQGESAQADDEPCRAGRFPVEETRDR